MPCCPDCQIAAIAVAHSVSAVRDLGFAGVVSTAAASALGIGVKRGLFDAPAPRGADSEPTGQSAAAVGAEPERETDSRTSR